MKKVILVLSLLLCFVLSNCSEQPTSLSDAQNMQKMDDTFAKAKASGYIPDTDITEQLRNDLNAGLDVKLPAGHYKVSESIFVEGYSGTVKGEGKDVTIIEAAQPFIAMQHPVATGFEFTPIFAVFWSKGDVTFKDMSITVTGDAPAEAHINPFQGNRTTIDNAIAVVGVHEEAESGITVTFKNLRIKGDDSTDPLSFNGKNLIYPLIATGFLGKWLPVNAVIKDCEIENSGADAIEYFQAFGGSGEIKDNEITNCYWGIWLGWGLETSEVTVKDNRFNSIANDVISKHGGLVNYCLKNNTLDGVPIPDDCQ